MGILGHKNRLDYGEALMPDDGWKTSWAIGTTYSLELDTLLSVPMGLFQAKYLTESTDLHNLRTDMLHALRQVNGKVFIFTHADNIRTGTGIQHIQDKKLLYTYLDQNIFNVHTEPHHNFHPKVWLIRYETINPAEKYDFNYRLIVTSRNITSATDFDLGVTLECSHLNDSTDENHDLLLMMTDLMKRAKTIRPEQSKRINHILAVLRKELKQIRFNAPASFDQKPTVFLPSGFKTSNTKYGPLSRYTCDEFENSLIISPFLDEESLKRFTEKEDITKDQKPTLISRQTELDKIRSTILDRYDCWKWNDILENAADYEENDTGHEVWSRSIGLHAKLIILKGRVGYDSNSWNNWFVGSANFTTAGFKNNYEAMLLLRGNKDNTSPEDVLATLSDQHTPLILPYIYSNRKAANADKTEEYIRDIKRELSTLEIKAETVNTNSNGTNILKLSIEEDAWKKFIEAARNKIPDLKISAHLMTKPSERWDFLECNSFIVNHVQITDYTPFLHICITYKADKIKREDKFLKFIEIQLPENRSEEVLFKILDDEEKRLNYLMFCLDEGMDPGQQSLIPRTTTKEKNKAESVKDTHTATEVPILEKLMVAKSRSEQAVEEIKEVIDWMEKQEKTKGRPMINERLLNLLKTMIG